MRREEDIVAGAAIDCGAAVLVPLLRMRAHAFTAWAGMAEADVVAFVSCAGAGAPRLVPIDGTPAAAADWSAWLAAHPVLVAEIRTRIAACRPAATRPA